MKFLRVCIGALILLALLVAPVLADDSDFVSFDVPQAPSVVPVFDPLANGSTDVIASWLDKGNETFDLWGIVSSLMNPYTDILGAWVFVILYALYIWSVYARSGGIALMGISLGITLPLWYTLFPITTWYCPVIIFCIAVTAIFYRLFKRR